MSRNTRLWQDPSAAAITYDGDITLGAQWVGYAKAQLNHMLQSTTGPLSATYAPTAEVSIRVDTRPNRIRIAAGSDVFVTVNNKTTSNVVKFDDYAKYIVPSKRTNKTPFYNERGLQSHYRSDPDGFWLGKGKCLSWKYQVVSGFSIVTFYIGGVFGSYQFLLPYNDHVPINAASVSATGLLGRFTEVSTYDNVIAVVSGKIPASVNPADYAIHILGVSKTGGNTATVTLLGSAPVTLPIDLQPGTENGTYVSGFTEDGRRFAIADYRNYSAERVYVIECSLDYSAIVSSLVYAQSAQHLQGSITTTQATTTFIAGNPIITGLKAEGDHFCLLRANYLSGSSVSTTTGGINAPSGTSSGTTDFSAAFQVLRLPSTGFNTFEIVYSSATVHEISATSSITDTQFVGGSSSGMSSRKDLVVLYYSSQHKGILYAKRAVTDKDSQTTTYNPSANNYPFVATKERSTAIAYRWSTISGDFEVLSRSNSSSGVLTGAAAQAAYNDFNPEESFTIMPRFNPSGFTFSGNSPDTAYTKKMAMACFTKLVTRYTGTGFDQVTDVYQDTIFLDLTLALGNALMFEFGRRDTSNTRLTSGPMSTNPSPTGSVSVST